MEGVCSLKSLGRAPHFSTSPHNLAEKVKQFSKGIVLNLKVWRMPCAQFAVDPGPKFKLTIDAKAQIHWQLRELKMCYIGESCLGSDPSAWEEESKAAWSHIYEFIGKIKLYDFRSNSFTLFQHVNHLVYYGLVQHPCIEEVVDFMVNGRLKKGTIKGLCLLRFDLDGIHSGKVDSNKVLYAFTIVYNALDKDLSQEIKELLTFDVIFIENCH